MEVSDKASLNDKAKDFFTRVVNTIRMIKVLIPIVNDANDVL